MNKRRKKNEYTCIYTYVDVCVSSCSQRINCMVWTLKKEIIDSLHWIFSRFSQFLPLTIIIQLRKRKK